MFPFPYAGIIRIRSEGMISAHIIGHPLACRLQTAAKIILFSELPRL